MENVYKCIYKIFISTLISVFALIGCGGNDNKKKEITDEPSLALPEPERVWISDDLSIRGSTLAIKEFLLAFCSVETHRCPSTNALLSWDLNTNDEFEENLVISMEQAIIPSEGSVAVTIRDSKSPQDVIEGTIQGTFTGDYPEFQWNPSVISLAPFSAKFSLNLNAHTMRVDFYWNSTKIAFAQIALQN